MSQTALSFARTGDRAAAPAVSLRFLPWLFAALGVIAPLALVIAATLGHDSAIERAQMIVQGGELLVMALMFTALLSLLYALGAREAQWVTAPSMATDLRLAGGEAA